MIPFENYITLLARTIECFFELLSNKLYFDNDLDSNIVVSIEFRIV